jgi:three-Cys-motif partner protein
MKRQWIIRTYIALFAGPGKCRIQKTEKGMKSSPILSLSCEVPFTHYFFNDDQSSVIRALKARAKSYSSANVDFFNKDCNLVVDELLQKLSSNSLDFCFIEPFDWEIKYNSIWKLTEKRRMDSAVTFHRSKRLCACGKY